jgi:hypothetical protein
MKFIVLGLIALIPGLARGDTIVVSGTPVDASAPIPEAFVSFSLEFAFFPDFAGMLSFTQTLVSHVHIHILQGTHHHQILSQITSSTTLESLPVPNHISE